MSNETASARADSDTTPGPARRRGGRARTVLATLVAIIAMLGVLTSVVAVWAQRVLFDSASMVRAVESALDDPEVTDALAVYLTDQVFVMVDVEAYLLELAPEQLGPLVPVVVGGARSVVSNEFEKVLASEQTRTVLVTAVERSHDALMRLLEGDGMAGGITVVDGEVTVNLLPVLSRGLIAVQDAGLFEDLDVPEFAADGDPAAQIADLEAMLGRDLPDTTGQLVVYRSEALAQGQQSLAAAQRALVLLKRAIVALLIVTVAALVGAVLLAHRRRRMAIVLVLSTAVVMLVVRALTKHVAEAAPSLAVQPGARAAIQSVVDALVAGLFALVEVTLLVSLVVAVVVWLTGNGRRAASLRGRAGTGSDGVLAFATDHREATAVVSFGLAALLVTVGGLSAVPLVLALVAVAMGVWALAFAAR
jgi:hypothetical protein